MLIKEIELQNYLFNTTVDTIPEERQKEIIESLRKEMIEIFSGANIF